MTVEHGFVHSFKSELFSGVHDFADDALKIALYDSDASMTLAGITAYTTANECSGVGYTAGGVAVSLASGFPKMNETAQGGVAAGSMYLVDFSDTTFSAIDVHARCALLYNSSKSNKAIAILDFGQELNIDGEFVIQWPNPDTITAIIRGV
ncbi:MAG: hypothetical protein ACXWYM_00270 [Candidatus Binatia bacterium]